MDLVEYSYLKDDGFILFLDFKKTFDMIEHMIGFGEQFISVIKMIYRDMSSSVSLPFGTTQRFQIGYGIRQGCPLSPLLFILAVDMLSTVVSHDLSVKKLNVFGKTLAISQSADYFFIFTKQRPNSSGYFSSQFLLQSIRPSTKFKQM